jgi:hypothetical protein
VSTAMLVLFDLDDTLLAHTAAVTPRRADHP